MPSSLSIPFTNAYAQLPDTFYARQLPTPVCAPRLLHFNRALAEELGITGVPEDATTLAELFSGNQLPHGADPLAMAYCGHQFGQLNPQLGDGRALLLGDLIDRHGQRRDLQLKGSGRTPFSRGGDGRCPLGPALREYLLCEAMQALGVATTRALAVVYSGEPVWRQQAEPGAIFTRVATSHIRVGTFQYFALRRDETGLQTLADHVLARHYPQIDPHAPDRYQQLLAAIIARQARLISQWMLLGFIHGVMNTDNMTVSGETIDYGPCAFMDHYQRDTVFSAIDRHGRYAYRQQPAIGQWNLARLAETLLPLLPGSEAEAIEQATDLLQDYRDWQQQSWQQGMSAKLGFANAQENDDTLYEPLLEQMERIGLDYTLWFRQLATLAQHHDEQTLARLLAEHPGIERNADTLQPLHHWLTQWRAQLQAREGDMTRVATQLRATNPAIIPRNHRVAEAIHAAEQGDERPFHNLLAALANPYQPLPEHRHYRQPPQPEQRVRRTFCGT